MHILRDKIMLSMLPRCLVNKTSLLSIIKSSGYGSYVLSDLIKTGLVKEKKFIDNRTILTYIELTKKGLLYLSENTHGSTQEIIQTSMSQSCNIRGKTNSEWLNRTLRVQSVSTMIYGTGLDIMRETEIRPAITNLQPQSKKVLNFGEAMLQTTSPTRQDNNSIKTEKIKTPVLYTAKELSTVDSSSVKIDTQYYFTNYTHLLVNCCSAYLLYHSKSDGLTISPKATNRSISLANRVLANLGVTQEGLSHTQAMSAIIFCPSLSNFSKTVSSLLQKGANRFGAPHTCVHVIPETYDGASIVIGLIENGNNYHKDLCESSLLNRYPNGEAYDNGKTDFICGETNYCIGVDMDLRRIVQFDEQANQQKNIRHVLVCEEWQSRYFKKVIKNAEIEIKDFTAT